MGSVLIGYHGIQMATGAFQYDARPGYETGTKIPIGYRHESF